MGAHYVVWDGDDTYCPSVGQRFRTLRDWSHVWYVVGCEPDAGRHCSA